MTGESYEPSPNTPEGQIRMAGRLAGVLRRPGRQRRRAVTILAATLGVFVVLLAVAAIVG
jgi:hypothetical protein